MGQEVHAQGALVPMGALPAPGEWGAPGAASSSAVLAWHCQQSQRLPHLDQLLAYSPSVTQEGAEAGGAKGGCAHTGAAEGPIRAVPCPVTPWGDLLLGTP